MSDQEKPAEGDKPAPKKPPQKIFMGKGESIDDFAKRIGELSSEALKSSENKPESIPSAVDDTVNQESPTEDSPSTHSDEDS